MNYPPTQLYDGANGQADQLLDFETDSDTHFQCPQCGQKGSVPTATLERALSETPHVHISCSSCAHKFEAFADLQEADIQEAGLETGANDENNALSAAETAAETASAMVPPLDEHWQQGDTTQDASAVDAPAVDDTADNREGDPAAENDTEPESSLPSWMLAEVKPAPETASEEAAAEDETAEEAAAEPDEVDAIEAEAETALDAPDTDHDVDDETAASAPETGAPDMPDVAERLNIEEVPYSPPSRSGPVDVINGILLLVVVLLIGLNSYVLLQDKPQIRDIFTAAPLATASINVQTADFERFSDADGDSVEIAVRFINSGEKAGIIGDFRIDLQDSARQTLVSWTVLSSGETVAPGQSRTVNSTLFGPPAGLAHVAIAYPLDK